MISLDAATVLLQWAVGGMAFCWFTTRRRQVGLGYGWLLRGDLPAAWRSARSLPGWRSASSPVREAASLGVARDVPARPRRVDRAPPRRRRRAARRARPAHGAGRGDDRHRANGGAAEPTRRRRPRVPAGPRPRAGRRRRRRARRRGPRRRRQRRRRRCCARSPAPRSSARSPTPCCSATGTSCSRGCRAACSTSWSTPLGWVWPVEVVALLLPTGMISVLDRRRRRRLGRHARLVLGGLRGRRRSCSSS